MTSLTELFTIGIGPSSSHTVGPMRAALAFANAALDRGRPITRVQCDLYGSLSLTGRGHGTDAAILMGLAGETPEAIDPNMVRQRTEHIIAEGRLKLARRVDLPFLAARDLLFNREFLLEHPNGMQFTAWFDDGSELTRRYYSIGGGVVRTAEHEEITARVEPPHPFESGAELLTIGDEHGLSIVDIMRANEATWREPAATDAFLDMVRAAMFASIDRGSARDGTLPGGLRVERRAHAIHQRLVQSNVPPGADANSVFEWVSLYALAVNEENASGGRVVTAPTNGAAGVIPAVLKYYEMFVDGGAPARSRDFLYVASAIGMLFKKRASISAAEMGCQGEVGVACSMAAAGLAAVLGGSNRQIENAAEMGMEHNLGLTCDPVGGLVQIPCIERNTMGAIKAINAAYLALQGDGHHIVSLDQVIETMRQTGEDMKSQYKETSQGGLAVNVIAC